MTTTTPTTSTLTTTTTMLTTTTTTTATLTNTKRGAKLLLPCFFVPEKKIKTNDGQQIKTTPACVVSSS